MKHLILGSSGQVGAYLASYIKSVGDEVIEWDIAMGKGYDLADEDNLGGLSLAIEESDFVHFLAYDVGGSTYLAKYQKTYNFVDNNIRIMKNVFGILEYTGKPFYFASSQMSNMFHSTYGRLKAIGESYTNSINGINIRFWNVYGCESDPEKTHVITDFIRMALADNRIIMRTSGVEERNFLYANDASKLLYGLSQLILNNVHKEENILSQSIDTFGAVPILSSHPFTSMIKIAEIIRDILNSGIEIYGNIHKVDLVQGVKNDINLEFVASLNKFIGLEYEKTLFEGISEIISKEKENL